MVKVFEVRELSQKFERHMDCEVVDFVVSINSCSAVFGLDQPAFPLAQSLSDDFGKIGFLHADRTLSFHAPYGFHYSTRVPKHGRDLLYNPTSCDLLVGACSNEIYRMNLDEGRFMAPLVSSSPAVNKLALNPNHGLLATGGEDGIVECWDLRCRYECSCAYRFTC